MFSGIIAGMAIVVDNDSLSHILTLKSPLFQKRSLELGTSIAVDGVCLTLIAQDDDKCSFELGEETKKKTHLVTLDDGDRVNIEFSLRMGDEISGHFVQGHVDSCAIVTHRQELNNNIILTLSYPSNLRRLLVKKGSVALNGVSLTINELDEKELSVCLLPYTYNATNLGISLVGQKVHIEVDVLGRYVSRLMPSSTVEEIHHDC